MALTPDEIERRTFPIADWGYDRGEVHKFLVETAATLRYAQHTTMAPPQGVVVDKGPDSGLEPSQVAGVISEDGVIDLARVGGQVTRILEAAESLASGLRADAEKDLIASRAEAEKVAAERRREAEEDAALIRDQAKRVLVAAQDQATRMIHEAEEEAATLRLAGEQRLKVRNEKIQRVAQQHADRVVRYERDTVRRLQEARGDLDRAIERLTGSRENPVVDLSEPRPKVRTGTFEDAEDGAAKVPFDPTRLPVAPTVAEAVEPRVGDPVSNLVRAAVERAVEHSNPRRPPRDSPPDTPSTRSGATPAAQSRTTPS